MLSMRFILSYNPERRCSLFVLPANGEGYVAWRSKRWTGEISYICWCCYHCSMPLKPNRLHPVRPSSREESEAGHTNIIIKQRSDSSMISTASEGDVAFILRKGMGEKQGIAYWKETFLFTMSLLKRPNISFLSIVICLFLLFLGMPLPSATGCALGNSSSMSSANSTK